MIIIDENACQTANGALHKSLELLSAFFESSDIEIGEGRFAFAEATKIIATYVTAADGLSYKEKLTIEGIFNFQGIPQCGDLLLAFSAKPSILSGACETYEDALSFFMSRGDKGKCEQILSTLTLICQTALAADDDGIPEVERLASVTSGLRALLSTEGGPSGQRSAPRPESSAKSAPVNETADSILAELHALVGLESVKQEVETLANLARIFQIRKSRGMQVPQMSFHLVFSGRPGTGKTTVARILGRLYGALGLLSKGQLIETDRSGLVANYVGQTATKVKKEVARALGGVLFIDEAYALDGGGQSDYGEEAIATLLKAMEDHRDDFVVIAAGYTDQMQRFMSMNPGLRSRIPRDLSFPDYTPNEMVAIFQRFAQTSGYAVDDSALPLLLRAFQNMWSVRGKDFANARDVRNLFERSISCQANRLSFRNSLDEQELQTLTSEDVSTAILSEDAACDENLVEANGSVLLPATPDRCK